jgi:hypothetical protein
VTTTLVNEGYGRVIRRRPASLVLIHDRVPGVPAPIPLAQFDVRKLASATLNVLVGLRFGLTLPTPLPEPCP